MGEMLALLQSGGASPVLRDVFYVSKSDVQSQHIVLIRTVIPHLDVSLCSHSALTVFLNLILGFSDGL